MFWWLPTLQNIETLPTITISLFPSYIPHYTNITICPNIRRPTPCSSRITCHSVEILSCYYISHAMNSELGEIDTLANPPNLYDMYLTYIDCLKS